MFESNFTRWEWLKVSLIIAICQVVYNTSKTLKKIIVFLYIFLILWCIMGVMISIKNSYLILLPILTLVVAAIILEFYYMRRYSQTFIYFYSTPSKKKQEIYSSRNPLQVSRKYGATYNFQQHTILSRDKYYTLLLESNTYFFLFYNSLYNNNKRAGKRKKFIVIKKNENQDNFIEILKPYCNQYKKINC